MLYWVLLSNAIGVSAMLSVLPAVGRESGIPDALIVSIQALSAVLGFMVTPLWAARSDRVGRKPIILLGCAGFALSCVVTGTGMLIGIRHWAPPLAALGGLIAGRAVYGAFGLASVPAAQAYVAERTTPQTRTRSLAALASSQGIGSIVGPAVAPFLIFPPLSLAGPLLIIGALSIFTLLVVTTRLPASLPRGSRPVKNSARPWVSAVWRDKRLQPFIVSAALVSVSAVAGLQMIGFRVIDMLDVAPIAAQPYAALALMGGAIAALVGQLGFIRWFHMTPPQLLLWGAGLGAAGNLIMAFAPDYPIVAAAFAISSLGYAFARPGYVSGASLIASGDEQGEVAGIIMSAGMTGLIFAPIVAMTLYHVWRPLPFLLCSGLMIGLGGVTLRGRARESAAPRALERADVETQRDA